MSDAGIGERERGRSHGLRTQETQRRQRKKQASYKTIYGKNINNYSDPRTNVHSSSRYYGLS